jgi:hypothetical protein
VAFAALYLKLNILKDFSLRSSQNSLFCSPHHAFNCQLACCGWGPAAARPPPLPPLKKECATAANPCFGNAAATHKFSGCDDGCGAFESLYNYYYYYLAFLLFCTWTGPLVDTLINKQCSRMDDVFPQVLQSKGKFIPSSNIHESDPAQLLQERIYESFLAIR